MEIKGTFICGNHINRQELSNLPVEFLVGFILVNFFFFLLFLLFFLSSSSSSLSSF
jgi:hypothetical protein